MTKLPPLEALEAVIASNETGSFSAAAESLGLTHGAVSRRVAAVEAWAGYRVFERHGRGVRPTPAGYALLMQIERAIALLNDGRSIREGSLQLDIVRVGVVASFARMWLIPNLVHLEGRPADLRIEPEIGDSFMTLSNSRIAIRYGTGDWPGVKSVPLFAETAVPVACRFIAEEFTKSAEPRHLLDWPLLHDASSSDWTSWLGRAGVAYDFRREDRILPAYDLALLAAAAGLGITLLREPYGTTMAKALDLQPLPLPRHAMSKQFYVLLEQGSPRESITRLVARILKLASGAASGSVTK